VIQDLDSPWFRGIIAIVFVTVAVNIGFILYAFISPPNLVVQDYYDRGKNYFHDESIRQKNSATAWRLQLLFPNAIKANVPVVGRLYVVDHQGVAVNSGSVRLKAFRPSDAEQDFGLTMKWVDAGTFSSPITFPSPGNWDLIASIDAEEQQFDTAMRIFVGK